MKNIFQKKGHPLSVMKAEDMTDKSGGKERCLRSLFVIVLMSLSISSFSQNIQVRGIVVDKSGALV